MMSKLQHVINYMDMYRILPIKETFLAWKGGGAGVKKAFVILIGIPIRDLR